MQATDKKPLFSILIPTWNNLPYLKICVESILKNSTFSHQLILHINEGTDGTLDWVKSQPNLTYTFSQENIGICHALNQMAAVANTDYICYFNDDMYALPNWDKVLKNEIESLGHEKFFLSATMIEPFEGKNQCVITGKDFGDNPTDFKETELLQNFETFPKNDWNGASWPPNVVHKKMWDAVGGYSIEFSPGLYSDPDFSMKLWKQGVRYFKGLSASRVYHFGSKSLKRIKMNDGRTTFKKKWGITPGFFDKHFLKKGKIWTGILENEKKSLAYWANKMRVALGF